MALKTREIFSKRMREAIEDSHLTQREISKRLRISTDTIQRWVNGKNTPSPDNMDSICELLEVTPSWLMGGTNSIPTRAEKVLKCIDLIKSIKDIDLAINALEAISEGENGAQSKNQA